MMAKRCCESRRRDLCPRRVHETRRVTTRRRVADARIYAATYYDDFFNFHFKAS